MSMKTRRITFGKWLKERREAARLTQMDLAKKLNYENPQIISNIERGFSALPSGRVGDFASILQCSNLELELRRVLSSTKDESSVKVIEVAINCLPLVESLCAEDLTSERALEIVNNFRVSSARRPVKVLTY
jgi:transcriptional regulator with XRE-family HTH domain